MKKNHHRGGGMRLLLIQTAVCAAVLLMIAAVRLADSAGYEQLRSLYWQGMSQSLAMLV